MEVILGVLAFTVATLAILQGWQMFSKRNHNPTKFNSKLDSIVVILGRMEQRLNDIWTKVNKD